jgi:hypothetical protein
MSLDQFYTKDEVANKYFQILSSKINLNNFDIILEPSAGKGAFYKILPIDKRVGLDIDPKFKGIQKLNYFDYKPKKNNKYLVIGNPPFGRVSSLAVKFFNKSAEFADVIAFILPRTFKRVSIQNQLNKYFHLIYNKDLPLVPCCFEPIMSAKCCFQIWQRKIKPRKIKTLDTTHPDFTFIKLGPKNKYNQPTPPDNVDFAIKAFGSNVGEIIDNNLHLLTAKSFHWIKSNIPIENLKNNFKLLNYSISKDTVRQDSIGRKELVYLYKKKFG